MESSNSKLDTTNYTEVYDRQWMQDQHDAQYFGDTTFVPEKSQLLDLFRNDEKMAEELSDEAMSALADDVIEYISDQLS